MKKPQAPPPESEAANPPVSRQEPAPEREPLNPLRDEGDSPLRHGGQVRGDQQAMRNEAQFGGVERGTSHRGRDSQRRNKSHHR